MRNFKDEIGIIIKFAKEFHVPYWETPYKERKTSYGYYILYEINDGSLIVNLYKYDEDFDHNDLIKSICIDSLEDVSLYEKLDDNFGDILQNKLSTNGCILDSKIAINIIILLLIASYLFGKYF